METPSEGERDSLLRDVGSSTSDESTSTQGYGAANEEEAVQTLGPNWEFAGQGTEVVYNNLIVDEAGFEAAKAQKYKHALGQLVSTAISGAKKKSLVTFRMFHLACLVGPHRSFTIIMIVYTIDHGLVLFDRWS